MRPFLFLLCAPVLFGQLELNTITVTATRTITIQPDQAVLDVQVYSPLDATFDQVAAAIQPAGITAAQFSGFSTTTSARMSNPFQPLFMLQWEFTAQIPLGRLNYQIGLLNTLQQSLSWERSPFSVSFDVSGLGISPARLAAQQCSNADLIADARAQAQKIAAAAAIWLGEVSSVAEPVYVPTIAVRTGDFTSVLALSRIWLASANTPVTCSLLVKFSATQ